jgi:hypothetical protein
MDVSGRPREGWMTVVPVTVFLLFVVLALGGVDSFVNTLGLWASEVFNSMGRWFRNLV